MEVKDMLAKLNALEAAQPCPACGNNEWQAQTRLVSVPTVVDGRINPTEGLECVALLCKACGYARFHSTGFLEQDASRR